MKKTFHIIAVLLTFNLAQSAGVLFVCTLFDVCYSIFISVSGGILILSLVLYVITGLIYKKQDSLTIRQVIESVNEEPKYRILNAIFFHLFLVASLLLALARFITCDVSCGIYLAVFIILAIMVPSFIIFSLYKYVSNKNK